jgi:hypothetical protein
VTRDKREWTHTPDDLLYSGKVLLPSFGIEVDGIEVTRSDPRSEVYLRGEGIEDLKCDSGDAFSISYLDPQSDATTVDRPFMGLDPAYIRRALLLVLDGEEYDDILLHYTARDHWEVKPSVPEGKRPTLRDLRKVEDPDPKAQVRITDLRLAKDLRRLELKSELKAEVPELRPPFTTDDVLRWKWETLRKPPKHLRELSEVMEKEEWYEEERIRIRAISFAAAALCLSVDLGLEIPEESSPDDLTEIILDWHTLISNLISALDKAAGEASKLLAGRKGTKGGRPTDPELKFYTALVLYRMGHFPNDIATRIDLRGPIPTEERKDGIAHEKVNPNWKSKLYKAIEKGIDVEQEKFPLAAEVFARRDEEEIRERALAAYDDYCDRYVLGPENASAELEDGEDLLGMPANETVQMQKAMIQLGSCIKRDLDPLSPNLN